MHLRKFISVALWSAFALGQMQAQAETFPSRPIKLIVPYAAGGSTDFTARVIAQRLGDKLGQPVVVDNKPGASEQIGAAALIAAPPDGYTLMLTTTAGLAINPPLYGASLRYNPSKDYAPVIAVAAIPHIVVVHPSLPVKNFSELTAYIKSNPGKLSYASAGSGTPSHLGMEIYKHKAGLDIVHVPFKGGAPAVQSLVAGQTQVMMAVAPESMPMVTAGKLRVLASTALKRTPVLPDVRTVDESGLEGFSLDLYYGIVAPAKTPKALIGRLNTEIEAILKESGTRAKFNEGGMDLIGGSPEAFGGMAAQDLGKYKQIIDAAQIKVE